MMSISTCNEKINHDINLSKQTKRFTVGPTGGTTNLYNRSHDIQNGDKI